MANGSKKLLYYCLHIYIPPKSPFGKGGLISLSAPLTTLIFLRRDHRQSSENPPLPNFSRLHRCFSFYFVYLHKN